MTHVHRPSSKKIERGLVTARGLSIPHAAMYYIQLEILQRPSLPETMTEFVGDRPGHDFRYSLKCDKISRSGWKPQVDFDEGLQKTIDWYRTDKWW